LIKLIDKLVNEQGKLNFSQIML